MISFTNIKTGENKTAYSYREADSKIYIRFTKDGKEYGYSNTNIKIHGNDNGIPLPYKVFSFKKTCYACREEIEILTYMIFSDGSEESLQFPWNKERLLEGQDFFAHIEDPSIEYYGLSVIGDNAKFDDLLMKRYPHRIACKYSNTQKRIYPMNVCEHCGAGQGWFYIYRRANQLIQEMSEITIVE